MSTYIKQEFTKGQVLKADQLNYMEAGIETNALDTATLSEEKFDKAQGVENAGKSLRVGEDGNIEFQDVLQSNWSENDTTSEAYIKNRLFYPLSDGVIGEINTTVKNGKFSKSNELNLGQIKSGVTYIVELNGETYECEAVKFDNVLLAGNAHIKFSDAADTGEPFVMYCETVIYNGIPATFSSVSTTLENGTNVTCKIFVEDQVVPIPASYVPVMDGVTVRSSTPYSTKKFKITVDDSGTLSAVEV